MDEEGSAGSDVRPVVIMSCRLTALINPPTLPAYVTQMLAADWLAHGPPTLLPAGAGLMRSIDSADEPCQTDCDKSIIASNVV